MNVCKKTLRALSLSFLLLFGLLPQLSFAQEGEGAHTAECAQLQAIAKLTREKVLGMRSRKNVHEISQKLHKFQIPYLSESIPDTEIYGIKNYLTVDLDGDGKEDKIQERCGDGFNPICETNVRLTSGGRYSTMHRPGYLVRVASGIYHIATQVGSNDDNIEDFTFFLKVSTRSYQRICQ